MIISNAKTVAQAHNLVLPQHIDTKNYKDPYAVIAAIKDSVEIPKDKIDILQVACMSTMKGLFSGFLDYIGRTIQFSTEQVVMVRSTTPDYSISVDGAVTRTGNEFTIDFSLLPGYQAGEDNFWFQKDDSVVIVNDAGLEEYGKIVSIDKATSKFVATSKSAAGWTISGNFSLITGGGDHAKGSCAPSATIERRKRKSVIQRFTTIKASDEGSENGVFCYDVSGREEMTTGKGIRLRRKLKEKEDFELILGRESEDGSDTHTAGSYGSLGFLQNVKRNGLELTGELVDLNDLRKLTDYYTNVLGFEDMTFTIFAQPSQYRKLENIAVARMEELKIQANYTISNDGDNYVAFGFKEINLDGFVFKFTKWSPLGGASALNRPRLEKLVPKAIIMPMGDVETVLDGVKMRVPYVFKGYRSLGDVGNGKYGGQVRTHFDGAFYGQGTCETALMSESTDVALFLPCPEAIGIITAN